MTDPFVMALVGCGKAKLDRPAPARDLYTGGLFRAARAHVEARYEHWGILSAKHHLVDPDRVLMPYDLAMTDLSAEQRWVWGEVIGSAARCGCGPFSDAVRWHFGCRPMHAGETRLAADVHPIQLDVYAGRPYIQALPQVWRDRFIINEPLAGLQIGERLRWFAERRTP